MRSFSYIRPATAPDAIRAFADAGTGARFIAGGTSLYDMMKLGIENPEHLIDVTAIAGIDRIETSGASLRFGALALMSDVATNRTVLADYPILAESLWKAASQQLRNMATVGGNLLQRTRCSYFRGGAPYSCNKRDPGSGCSAIGGLDRGHAILGGSDACIAVYPGDWAVALLALDASIETLSPRGAREVSLATLHVLPGTTPHIEHILAADEMIVSINVPKTPSGRRSTYHKIRDRESYAFALVSTAVAIDMDGDIVSDARIALGGVATKPWRATAAERSLIGNELTDEAGVAAGRLAFADATPGRHNGFKADLGARAIADALQIARSRT